MFLIRRIGHINGNKCWLFSKAFKRGEGMKNFLILLTGIAVGLILSIFISDQSLILVILILLSIVSILISYLILRARFSNQDAIYINSALRAARKKNRAIRKYRLKWIFLGLSSKINRICELNKEIITTIKKNPDRFRLADNFFSLYLDSTQNILKRYENLRQGSVRNQEIRKSLYQTEKLLDKVIQGLEGQLKSLLKDEITELELEKEVLEQYGRGRR